MVNKFVARVLLIRCEDIKGYKIIKQILNKEDSVSIHQPFLNKN
jgi:hypothetical protein